MERENLRVVTACIPVDGHEDTGAVVEIDAHGEYEHVLVNDVLVCQSGKVHLDRVKAASKQQKMVYYRALATFIGLRYETKVMESKKELAKAIHKGNEVADRLEGHLKDAQAEVETLKRKLTHAESLNNSRVNEIDNMRRRNKELSDIVASQEAQIHLHKAQADFYGRLKHLCGRLYWRCK